MTSPLKAVPAYLFGFLPFLRKAGEDRDMEGALRNAKYLPLGDASSEEIKLRNNGNDDIDEALLQDGKSAPAPCPSCWRGEKKQRSRLHTFVRVIVVLLSIFGLIDLCIRAAASIRQPPAWHALTGENPTCYCGNSTAEALALGCKYDSLAQGWLPDHCRDDELAEEFEKSGPNEGGGWNFYRDKNHTIPMSYDEVSMLADTGGHWFVEWDWHAAHCMFYWKKQWRSWHTKGHELYETTTGAYEHIAHCENAIRWTYKGTTGWVNIGGDH